MTLTDEEAKAIQEYIRSNVTKDVETLLLLLTNCVKISYMYKDVPTNARFWADRASNTLVLINTLCDKFNITNPLYKE